MSLTPQTILHTPSLTHWHSSDGLHFAIDADGPNWIATDGRGAKILTAIDGRTTLAQLVAACRGDLDPAKAWLHVHSFVQSLVRAGIARTTPFARPPYAGRAAHLAAGRLREFWIHTNNSCNLTCEHCLVSSGPDGDRGLATETLFKAIDQAAKLGVERFYFTGGEPFLRKDVYELIARVTGTHDRELVILTNATLFESETHKNALSKLTREKVRFQVSIDGTNAADNDPIRGKGSFEKASRGLQRLSALGFETSLTAVPCRGNLRELPKLPSLAKALGASSVHLMWPHRRGRALQMLEELPSVDELLAVAREVRAAAAEAGVRLDNVESLNGRVNAVPGVKHDLGMAGVESLCLYSDGVLYPSAATADHKELAIGILDGKKLEEVWKASPVAAALREASIARKPSAWDDPLRFILGGGDVEHAYFWGGSFLSADPYERLYRELAKDAMHEMAARGRDRLNRRAGYDAPVIFHAMGDGALACGDEAPGAVRTLHSNCVLAFDVDRPRALVREFYGAAAEKPKAELCCPVRPSEDDLRHIPKDVVDRFYGCGSPVQDASIALGETTLDLGSGAGIDVFISAKYVGKEGKAIGVDMTDAMLGVARENKPIVARNLGYDVVDFHKGFLEKVPVADRTVDVVTSNCVVNLSPDKRAVFGEIWRVLKDHGRLVLADIVVDRAVPPHLRVNPQLWGECLTGALTEDELMAELERAGFYGLEILKKSFWQKVEGYVFSSVTVRAFKFEKKTGCVYLGHRAVYQGPYKSVSDEEGHLFPRYEEVEVCTDTAAKLTHAPYSATFTVLGPDGQVVAAVDASRFTSEVGACGPGCC